MVSSAKQASQPQEDSEWDQLGANMESEVVPENYMKPGTLLQTSQEAVERGYASRVNSLEYKGYVKVWDTRTGVESLQPHWLRWQYITKKREDGSLVFTETNPHIPQKHGMDLKCPLHPQSPDHDRLVSMGFKECVKQHIPHQDGLNRHIRKSHSRVKEVLEQERTDRIREEDRIMQRDQIETNREMLRAMTSATVRDVQQRATRQTEAKAEVCPDCGKLGIKNQKLHDRFCPEKQT